MGVINAVADCVPKVTMHDVAPACRLTICELLFEACPSGSDYSSANST